MTSLNLSSVSEQFPILPWKTTQPASASTKRPESREVDIAYVAAHPDDETYMSQTLKKLAASGYTIQPIYLTQGEQGTDVSGENLEKGPALGNARVGQMKQHLAKLGIKRTPVVENLGNDKLAETEVFQQALAKVKGLLAQFKPKVVISFAPHGMTGHPDHIATGLITSEAVAALKSEGVLNANNQGGLYQLALSEKHYEAYGEPAVENRNTLYPRQDKGADAASVQQSHPYFMQHAKASFEGGYDPVDVKVHVGTEAELNQAVQDHRVYTHAFYPEESEKLIKDWYKTYPYQEFKRALSYFA